MLPIAATRSLIEEGIARHEHRTTAILHPRRVGQRGPELGTAVDISLKNYVLLMC